MHTRFLPHSSEHSSILDCPKLFGVLGKFAYYNMNAPQKTVLFLLDTNSTGIDGAGAQCLTYYYYLPNINGTNQNIKVIKQEVGSVNNVIIDTVANSSYNGWIKHQVDYNVEQRGYQVMHSS
jgi:hypothetical protein